MKIIKRMAAALSISLILCSCGTKKDIDANDMAAALSQSIAFDETLTELDQTCAENYFMMNPNDYEQMSAYVSTKACCDELAVIKTYSPNTVKEKLTAHISELIEDYESFRPTEVSKLESAVINTYKDTVVLIIAPDIDEAQTAYKEYMKK
ncbi:MAG: DUF4358 domain-containing protein [Clostridia bacterium]|nr:DUF4358 domain-containing protein [Clostridia bacterium]